MIAIIGVLAGVLVPAMLGIVKKANRAADITTAKKMYDDIEQLLATDDAAMDSYLEMIARSSGKREGWVAYEPRTDEEYELMEVMRIGGTKKYGKEGPYSFAKSQDEAIPLRDMLNTRYGWDQNQITKKNIPYPIKYNKTVDGGGAGDVKVNGWSICMRKDNHSLEIWASSGSLSWNSTHYVGKHKIKGQICYRLYPSPDPDY